jgi:hypothetical protein
MDAWAIGVDPLHVLPAQLHDDAGVVNAAAPAMHSFVKDKTE